MNILLALLLSLICAAPAWAVPYSYEFLSGAVTGDWTINHPVTVEGDLSVIQTWHITDPMGNVWDSSNPLQGIHDTANYGYGYGLDFGPATFNLLTPDSKFLTVNIDGQTYANPTAQSGLYSWRIVGFGSGTGTWEQLNPSANVQSVPLPSMLWMTTFIGLAGLGWLWWREWRRGL